MEVLGIWNATDCLFMIFRVIKELALSNEQ
jgi:hypothetical protein